ncbi:hypothetical protein ACFOW3_24020 [Acidovorax facilis]|uniref:Uncharacterized protein n=1 Tax=Acidovorax facilis TaxID=12917 RepID=A0ABV8DHJ4_9BURK
MVVVSGGVVIGRLESVESRNTKKGKIERAVRRGIAAGGSRLR